MKTAVKNNIQRYQSYKNSDVVWLGKIPEQWETLPISAIFDERNEKNDGPKTDFILSVTKDRGVIPYDEKGAIGNNKSEEIERYKLVYPNDFVINKMNVVIGSLGMSKYFGAFSQVYLVYKPKSSEINMNYYSYLFSNPSFYKSLIKYCTGIMELRESLNKNDFKKLVLPFPTLETQSAIVKFLDIKTTKIEDAIVIKEQQINLLKERKQILIQKAVTQGVGLLTGVEMKDSGLEWTGKIPKHWELKKLKYVCRIESGLIDPKKNQFREMNLIAPNHIESKTGKILFEQRAHEQGAESGKYIVQNGDLIYSKIRPELRKVCIATRRSLCSADMYPIRPFDIIDIKFLFLIFLGEKFNDFMINQSLRVAMPKVNREDVMNYSIAFPKIKEQKKIVNYIETASLKIESVISLKQQEIDKLKEYKSSLINGVVTGKVKVC